MNSSPPSSGPPRPTVLAANQPPQYYLGGAEIAKLRGGDAETDHHPEDWVASTTTRFGEASSGLSALPDGTLLRDAVAADPVGWLGAEHYQRFGADPALLVKLLDAGQRLPVHCHPSDSFAEHHFHSRCGKTEAWVVIGLSGDDPCVYAGFTEDVTDDTVRAWVRDQDGAALLGALNKLSVEVGDCIFVPAGLPHAIGEGVFIVELQQPADFSVTLEWQGFLADEEHGSLGIGFDTALGCLDRSGWDERRLRSIVHRSSRKSGPCVWLLSGEQERFFRAHRIAASRGVLLNAGFSVLIVLDGEQTLTPEHGEKLVLHKGDTVVIPHAAGVTEVLGEGTSIHCRPPAPGEPQ